MLFTKYSNHIIFNIKVFFTDNFIIFIDFLKYQLKYKLKYFKISIEYIFEIYKNRKIELNEMAIDI